MSIKHISGAISIPKTKLSGVHLKTNKISQKPTIIKSEGNDKVKGYKAVKAPAKRKHVTTFKVRVKKAKSVKGKIRKGRGSYYDPQEHILTQEIVNQYREDCRKYYDMVEQICSDYHFIPANDPPQTLKGFVGRYAPNFDAEFDDGEIRFYWTKEQLMSKKWRFVRMATKNPDKNLVLIDPEMQISGTFELLKQFKEFRKEEYESGKPYVARPDLKKFQNKKQAVEDISHYYGLDEKWKYYLIKVGYVGDERLLTESEKWSGYERVLNDDYWWTFESGINYRHNEWTE